MDRRELRQKRERADEWITYASWTAIGTAVLGAIVVLTIGLSDFPSLPATIAVLSALAAQAVVGHKFRATRSQWAAWGLMVTYATGAVLHALEAGIWSGIVLKLAIGLVYIRGFKASVDYEELTKQIQAPAASPSGVDAA